MKKILLLLSFLSVFCFGKLTAQTVYVTDNGKKYHAKNCSIVKTGKKGMEISEAKKQGYEACKNCKADEIKAKAEGKEEEKPKNKKK